MQAKALQEKIDSVNTAIAALEDRVEALETKVYILDGRITELENMVQSVAIVPAYSDGSVEAVGGELFVDFIVSPATAVKTLEAKDVRVRLATVLTKAGTSNVDVKGFKKDEESGIVSITADITGKLPQTSGNALMAAIEVKKDITAYTTDFSPVTFSKIRIEKNNRDVTVYVAPSTEESGEGAVNTDETFGQGGKTTFEILGVGSVTFDTTATSTIKTNANGADKVYLKVEDVTTTAGITTADIVYEVTMKTVDASGNAVFASGNASGEATLVMPIPNDVVYINTVTLVDDSGDPISGGIVDGSIVLDETNHTLTFRVNHFSKYAVDYVKSDQFKSVTGVTLDRPSLNLYLDASGNAGASGNATLIATVAPDNATNKKLTWASSDPSIVEISGNANATADASGNAQIELIAKKYGTATITVKTDDSGKTATCEVKVTEIKTMEELLATNSDIPEVTDLTPPTNAWVNSADSDCKAFVGVDNDGDKLFVILKEGSDHDPLGMCMDDAFERIDDNTYQRIEPIVGTFTIKMAEGKFTSYEFVAVSGQDDEQFNGTYSAPEYTVTFDLYGITGTAPTSQTIKYDEKVTKPADPTDMVHTFAGWYKTKDATTGALSDPWDFDNGTVTADMTLYAKWTRTLGSIYSNSDIPKADNNTAPDNAWENGDGGKAFIAYSGKSLEVLYFYKKLEPSDAKQLSCRKTENFTKIGDDYVLDYIFGGKSYGAITCHMTEGVFSSVTYNGAGTDYEVLSGTYTAPTAN